MKNRLSLLLVLVCLCGIPACGADSPVTPEPPRTTISVINISTETLSSVYIRRADANSWGENLLATPVGPRDFRPHPVVRAREGDYDVRLEGESLVVEFPGAAVFGEEIAFTFK